MKKIQSKKALKEEIATLKKLNETIVEYNDVIADKVQDMLKKYPFDVDQDVYELQLRTSTGRFTKTKPSKEHCNINAVTVTKRNYFNLVDKYNEELVFRTPEEAQLRLDELCK